MRSLLLLMLAVYVPNVTSTYCHIDRDPVDHNYTLLFCEVESSGDLAVTGYDQKVVKLAAHGSFSELKPGNSPLDWVKWLYIESRFLTTFDLNNYHGITSNLKKVDIVSSAQNLRITLSSELALDRLIIRYAQRINFDCESFKSSKLKHLRIKYAQHIHMDFNCLPPEMEWLELVNCNLQNGDLINMDEFQHHQNLSNFELRGNKDLTSLDTEHLPTSIETLNLNDNGLTSFSTDQLTRLDKLRELNLANNDLTSLDIATLPTSIETLNLNNNNLKLDLSSLPKLVNMQDLYLAGNTDHENKRLQEYHPNSQPSLHEFVHSHVTTTTAPATTTTPATATVAPATAAPATTTTPATATAAPATVAPATTTASTTSSTKRSTANDNEDEQPKGGDVADEQPEGGDVADEQPEGGDAADAADKKPEGDGDEDEESEGGETASGSSSNYVTMSLIIVICVRFIATLL